MKHQLSLLLQTNERETCRHYILNSANVLTVTFSKWDSKAVKQVQSTHKLKYSSHPQQSCTQFTSNIWLWFSYLTRLYCLQ